MNGFSAGEKRKFQLDPRTKLLIAGLTGIIAFASSQTLMVLLLVAVVSVLMFMARIYLTTIKFLTIFAIVFFLEITAQAFANNSLTIMAVTLVCIFQRFVILAMVGVYIAETTPTTALIGAMEKLAMPRQIIIPLAVALRFVPTIREEFGYLRDSMRIRKINTSFTGFILHPIKNIEYLLVPLLIRSYKIADELAASAMVRGIDSPRVKTVLYEIKFRTGDFLTMALFIIAVAGTPTWG
ncbi:Energy-coupling factor transporter transmembrane protein EcfT [Sporomusa ovata DSM 2662]|uniref:Transmembrane component BL0694 of energizing module of predicted ECF transporter n=1 Tax=Sporomusa ovata TaxID=2378 RepID=A0A0U1L205_9FIRM|nr:CbiQ family ECF transporter T component [Sporomusa ovata]EQB25028.1 ABC-type cobalt transport system, permease component CbiQ [Sporomusa ovata DSM 2662]CQR73575.1 Transmembrane component BL0694 of energizing module of predicted ECF transporter [Sporomusa ovata]